MIKRAYRTLVPEPIRAGIHKTRQKMVHVRPEPFSYAQDGLYTHNNADFMNDEKFARAYAAGEATGSWRASKIHWRVHVLCWAASIGKKLEGDFVECGVNRGGFAKTIIEYHGFRKLDKKFYLLDTYEGLKAELCSPAELERGLLSHKYPPCYEDVVATFSDVPNCVIIKGTVPDTLAQVKSDKVAFLSIDMNCAAPEIAAAEYFWPKLSRGAVIVLDDYGFPHHHEQKLAFDDFCKRKGVMILSLPTGQGVIIKD